MRTLWPPSKRARSGTKASTANAPPASRQAATRSKQRPLRLLRRQPEEGVEDAEHQREPALERELGEIPHCHRDRRAARLGAQPGEHGLGRIDPLLPRRPARRAAGPPARCRCRARARGRRRRGRRARAASARARARPGGGGRRSRRCGRHRSRRYSRSSGSPGRARRLFTRPRPAGPPPPPRRPREPAGVPRRAAAATNPGADARAARGAAQNPAPGPRSGGLAPQDLALHMSAERRA